MASLGRLTIDMVANLGGFETDMKRAGRATEREMRKVSRQLKFAQRDADAAAARIRNLGVQIAAVAAIGLGLVVREFRNMAKEADRIQKIAIATGLTAEAVQELGFAAEQSGSNMESVIKGVQQLQKNIVQAQDGLATYVRAFERVGIAVADLDGLSPEEQFLRMAEALARVEDPTVRTATAMELLGRAGKELIPFLVQGADGIEELRDQLRRTGSVMSQETVNATARFNDAMNLLRRNVQSVKVALFSDLIEPLSNVAEFFANTERGAERFQQLLNAAKNAAIALGVVIAGRFSLSMAIAITQLVIARREVARLTAAKAALGSTAAATAVSMRALGAAVSVAFGPIGIAVALIGTFALSARGLGSDLREAARGGVRDFREELDRLNSTMEELAEAPFKRLFNQIEVAIIETLSEIRDLKRSIANLPATAEGTFGEVALEGLNAQLDAANAKLEELQGQSREAREGMRKAREEAKRAGSELGGMGDDAASAAGDFDKLEDELDRVRIQLEDISDELSGPTSRATRQYARDLNRIVAVLVAANRPQREINEAVDILRARLEAAIKPADEFVEQIEQIIEFAERSRVDTLAEQILLVGVALETATDPAMVARLQAVRDILLEMHEAQGRVVGRDGISALIGQNFAASIVQGGNILDSLGRSLRATGGQAIIDPLADVFNEALQKGLTSAFKNLDPEARDAIAAGFALAIGQAIGGNVLQGVLTVVGAVIGGIITSGSEWGIQAGAAVGSLVGEIIGVKDPRFIVGGDLGFGALDRNLDEQFETVFGDISANFRKLKREAQRSIMRSLREFDSTIAAIVQDVDQRTLIEEALREFAFNSNQQAESIEDLLEARFDVILSTFDAFTQSLVREGISLEEQVQRLGDILGIRRAIEEGEGFADFERTIEVIQQLGFVGEGLAETFARLSQAFSEYADIVVGLERDIQLTPLNDFQRELVKIQQQLLRNIDSLNKTARAAGLQAAREEDLARAHEAAAVAVGRAVMRLEESTRPLVEELFGTALSRVRDQIREIEAASVDVGSAAVEASSGLARLREQLIRFADSLLVGALSPLPSGPRLEEAMRLLREASGRGDAGAVQQFAQSVLQIAQSRFASGQPFTDIFNEVQRIIRGTTPREEIQSVSVVSAPGISDELAALFEEERRLEQEAQDRRNQVLAVDIAQAVADLSEATGREFEDIADRLGFSLTDLGEILGFDLGEIGDFIRGLQVDTQDLASELQTLGDRIVSAIVDDLPRALADESPFDPAPVDPDPLPPPVDGGIGDPVHLNRIREGTDLTTEAVDRAADRIVGSIFDTDSSGEIVVLLRRIADSAESRRGRSDRTVALS